MAVLNCDEVKRILNMPKNGFYEITNVNIQGMGKLIQTAAGREHAEQNPKSIASPFGQILGLLDNMKSSDPAVRAAYLTYEKILYARIAKTAYTGEKLTFRMHTFDSGNALEVQCMKDLSKRDGWREDPEHILELCIDQRACGIFVPTAGCFIPAAGFREKSVHGKPLERFMEENPFIKNRYRAILTIVLQNGGDENIIKEMLTDMGGPMNSSELAIYHAEMYVLLPADIRAYICSTSGVKSAENACGLMGSNEKDRLLEYPVLINTGSDAEIHPTMGKIGDELVVIPPVRNTESITETSYKYGGDSNSPGIQTPSWIEFTAKLDGVLYHKIYTVPETGWKIKRPKNYIDLFYRVPDGILSRFNYLVKDPSEGPSLGMNELACSWKVYPEDETACIASLTSKQYDGRWEILQRSKRITHMELFDTDDGTILGTVFTEGGTPFKKDNNRFYVSLDPAGAVSVRLAAAAFSGKSEAITYEDLAHPVTPMASGEVVQILESCAYSADGKGTHFNSLLQTFFPENIGGWARLMLESRIWKPDQEKLFKSLKENPGNMLSAMTRLGVISNPKEMIARSNLRPEEKTECMAALKFYIGTMLLEAVVVLAKKGYCVSEKNLEFLISYPENGSGEGVTKMMKKAIKGALEVVNEYLEPANYLKTDVNVTLYSESEATAQWHANNPPAGISMGPGMAVGTPDYGHSTHDYSLRVNGHLYMFSIPYAAQHITNATLAKVYNGNAAALMRCFSGGSQKLMEGAREAIDAAMKVERGKLYERLGFVLSLNSLFSNCQFRVTGEQADVFQCQVQQMVEAKLNIAIPAYADSIAKAVQAGDLSLESDVFLAPVGKGSLAINNTAEGFEKRFITRLKNEIKAFLGKEYTGNIELFPNNDIDKRSVAQGLIDLQENRNQQARTDLVQISDEELVEYYLDLVYGTGPDGDEEGRNNFIHRLTLAAQPAAIAERNALREQLFDSAFKAIMDHYTYEDFEDSFNRWGYTGTGDGTFDEKIRATAKKNFKNLIGEMADSKKALIMSCPRLEKEMAAGAMLDLVMER